MHRTRWLVVGAVTLVMLISPINRAVGSVLDRIRHPSPRALEWAGLLIGVAATCYLIGTAFAQGRELFPKTEDDCSYVIGAQMMARGRLWMPMHPLADFFETFYVLFKPVYCSIYFPGAALAFAPMVWFGWASWIIPAVISGSAVGLLYRIMVELTDGAAAALAVLWMLSLQYFRTISLLALSHVPMLMLGLLMIWAWLRWRRSRRWGCSLALGVFSGWAAITRPADALAFALPIGIAMGVELHLLLTLRAARLSSPKSFAVLFFGRAGRCGDDGNAEKPRRREGREGKTKEIPPLDDASGYTRTVATGRTTLLTAALLVAGAAPFLALQVVFDLGVTGHALTTPYTLYLQQDQPGSQFGVRRFDTSWHTSSSLPEKQTYYDWWCRSFLRNHQPGNFLDPWFHHHVQANGKQAGSNLLIFADATLPSRVLLIFLPAGLLGLLTIGRRVLAATLPIFIAVYMLNPFFLEHYSIVVASAMILLVLLGCEAAASAWPAIGAKARPTLWAIVLTLSFTSLPELYRLMPSRGLPPGDELMDSPLLSLVNIELPLKLQKPAVVLFRQSSREIHYFIEPVYNTDVAWPDDAPIIHAHDLGPRDTQIIDYYAARQPQRMFYLFDTDTLTPVLLGDAASVQNKLRRGVSLDSVIHSGTRVW